MKQKTCDFSAVKTAHKIRIFINLKLKVALHQIRECTSKDIMSAEQMSDIILRVYSVCDTHTYNGSVGLCVFAFDLEKGD